MDDVQENIEKPRVHETKRKIGLCTLDTIRSIARTVSGADDLDFSSDEIADRKTQMYAAVPLVQKREQYLLKHHAFITSLHRQQASAEVSERWGPAVYRMDRIAQTNFIRDVSNSDSEMGRVLGECDIRFVTGGEQDIRNAIKNGWQVGVNIPLAISSSEPRMHTFHVGLEDGKFKDMSDEQNLTKETVDDILSSGELDKHIDYLRQKVSGWNMLMVRRKIT